jgi:hypothetical protein
MASSASFNVSQCVLIKTFATFSILLYRIRAVDRHLGPEMTLVAARSLYDVSDYTVVSTGLVSMSFKQYDWLGLLKY